MPKLKRILNIHNQKPFRENLPKSEIPLNIVRVDKRHEAIRKGDRIRDHRRQFTLAGLLRGYVEDMR